MTIQFSVTVQNAMLDAIETAIGTSAVMRIRSGAPPAACSTADSGTVLMSYSLASDWASAASSGDKSLSSLPLSGTASGTGTAAHFRVYASNGTTCHIQGTVATAGGDMTIDNASISTGQTINVTTWTLSAPGD